jgi:hypothetical protein
MFFLPIIMQTTTTANTTTTRGFIFSSLTLVLKITLTNAEFTSRICDLSIRGKAGKYIRAYDLTDVNLSW